MMSDDDQKYGEEYNQYVLNDGIWAKLDAKANADVLDMYYARARKKMRQHSGSLTTEEALELVEKEDLPEMINSLVQELREENLPLLAEAYKNEKTRDNAVRLLELMISDMEDPNRYREEKLKRVLGCPSGVERLINQSEFNVEVLCSALLCI